MKILIIGEKSFVGENFRRYSRYKDIEEISVISNKPEEINFGEYEVVLHLAAIVHQTRKIPESEYIRVNRDLCFRVAENAKKAGIKQFVFLSTLKVYGDSVPGTGVRNENSKCFPDDAYGRSKYEAEIGLKKLENADFTVSIIRPPLIYGSGVKANMLNLMKLIETFPILPFGDIHNRRNFVYIENLVEFIDKIIEKRAPGIFIAKDEGALSTTELVIYSSKYLGKKVTLFKLPKIIINICTYIKPGIFDRLFGSLEFDNSKTKSELNFSPPYSSEEGIKKWLSGFYSDKT